MAKKGYTHKITPIKPSKALKIFLELGFKQYPNAGGSSHITMRRFLDDPNFFVLVKHGSREIDPIAIKRMLKNADISEKDYLDVFNSI